MGIEIVLLEKIEDPRIRHLTISEDGMILKAHGFTELTLLREVDRLKLLALPISHVCVLDEPVGEIWTPAGVYLLPGDNLVTVIHKEGRTSEYRQTTASLTVKSPSIQKFMDTFALALNNKLLGYELVARDTPTYAGISRMERC